MMKSTRVLLTLTLALTCLLFGTDTQLIGQDARDTEEQVESQPERKKRKAHGKERAKDKEKARKNVKKRQFQGVDRLFSRFDTNDDGVLSSDELPEKMQQRLARVDTDKDGAISKQELVDAFRKRMKDRRQWAQQPNDKDSLKRNRSDKDQEANGEKRKKQARDRNPTPQKILTQFDKDFDQAISEEEAPKRLKKRFSDMDSDGDGKLDERELTSMIEKMKAKAESKKRFESKSDTSKGQMPKRPPRPE